jgi:parallel beta-helix repeat protein
MSSISSPTTYVLQSLRQPVPTAGAAVIGLLMLSACSDQVDPSIAGTQPTAPDSAVATAVPQTPDALVSVDGIAIYPGTTIQTKVDQYAAGTKFLIKAGTHKRQSIRPKSGDIFVGESGAVLDGEKATKYAFTKGSSPYPSNVRIQGLVIRNYQPDAQMGAILAGGHSLAAGTRGWIVESCDIGYNSYGGIRIGNKMQVLNNKVHHNAALGLSGTGDSTLIQGNEISYNDPSGSTTWLEHGGFKFVKTRWLTLRNNYVHHNIYHGMWLDTDNIYVLIEGNRVSDNTGAGIFQEIGYNAVIRNNTVERNGSGRPQWVMGSGILVAASPNVEIYGNIVRNNRHGINAIQQNRGSGAYGTHLVKNLYVHDNTVTTTVLASRSGLARDYYDNSIYTSWGNRFAHNTYYLGTNTRGFEWMNGMRSDPQWRGYGQDLTGTFNH